MLPNLMNFYSELINSNEFNFIEIEDQILEFSYLFTDLTGEIIGFMEENISVQSNNNLILNTYTIMPLFNINQIPPQTNFEFFQETLYLNKTSGLIECKTTSELKNSILLYMVYLQIHAFVIA